MKKWFLILSVLTVAATNGHAQVMENFNHGSRSFSRSNCWQLQNADIAVRAWSISSGGNAPMFTTSNLSGITGRLISPYVKFNGTGSINFRHRVSNTGSNPVLTVSLVDTNGSLVQTLLVHNYLSSAVLAEEILVQWTGIYKIVWEWTGSGGSSIGAIDDVSIHGSYASDPYQNIFGNCAVAMIPEERVCVGTENLPYNIYYPNSTSTYHWFFSDPVAGTIDSSVSVNNQNINISWGTTPGIYQLYVYEVSADGCIGDTVQMNVEVSPLPTFSFTIDSVCPEDPPMLDFDLTGTAPWIITLTDGTDTYMDTCSTSGCVLNVLPGYTVDTPIDVIRVVDGNGCIADTSLVPPSTVYIYPKPATGTIFTN